MPNIDILAWNANTDQGLVVSTTTKSSPLRVEGSMSANNKDFPSFYLEFPSLPIENVSASYLKGYENKFICPIKLSQSQTSQHLYTTKLYTELYNAMANNVPLNLLSLRCRICDLNGVPTKQLDKYKLTFQIRSATRQYNQSRNHC